MLGILGKSSEQAKPASSDANSILKPVTGKRKSSSSGLCISSGSMVGQDSSNYPQETSRMTSQSAVVKRCNQKKPNYDSNNTVQNCVSDSGSANSVVEDGGAELITGDSNQKSSCKIISMEESCKKIDIAGIRERLKRRKVDRAKNMRSGGDLEAETNGEAWIEREIEKGIELVSALS